VYVFRIPLRMMPSLIAGALVLASCRGQVSQQAPAPTGTLPPQAAPMGVAPEACEAAVAAPQLDLRLPPRPRAVLGGALLESGQFSLDVWLYCDPALAPAASGPAFSEIAGLGLHLAWRYHGPTIDGPVEYFFGPEAGPRSYSGSSGSLTAGSQASFTGGIYATEGALAKAISSGTPYTYMMEVKAGGVSRASAALTFTLKPTATGLNPVGISVKAVSP